MAFKPFCNECSHWHTESEWCRETAICTLCAGQESVGFYTGCLVMDGHIADWQCDGKGNLSRPPPEREPCHYCGDGKRTGLPGNACENCMNTGYANPTAEDLK